MILNIGIVRVSTTNISTRNDIRMKQALHYYEDHTAFFYGKISAASAALISFVLTTEFSLLFIAVSMMVIMACDVGNITVLDS